MAVDLMNVAAEAVAIAKKAGASAADAIAIASQDQSVSLRHGTIEELEHSESQDVGLRVFVGQSSGLISGSVLTRDGLNRLVERAIAMAKLAPPDEFAGLASSDQLARNLPDLDLHSSKQLSAEELQSLARRAEDSALSVKGITKSNGASASQSKREVAIVASNGFARAWKRSSFGIGASVVAGEGTSMERDYDGHGANHFEDMESPEEIGTRAGERTIKKLNPRKVNSQTVPVVFDRRISTSLIGHLLGAISGSSIARGTSFLKGEMGKMVFNPAVTIIDDPHRLRGPGSRPVDGEGLPTNKMNFIDKGILTSWVLDLRSARQLKLVPTGHGSRGLSSPPSPSTSNVHIVAGTRSPEEMMKSIGTGFLVTEFIGSSINGVTGDYSRGASGFWIENGEIAYPVSEVTIAGNLKDMFKAIEPASDLQFRSATNAPSCFLGEMTLAGR
jgi:PmbA protein